MTILQNARKLAVILISVSLLNLLFGCGVGDKEKIFDDNERISQEGDSYNFKSRTGPERKDLINIDFKGFSGVETIWLIEVKEGREIELVYDAEVTKGDFKIVLVTPAREVKIVAEQSEEGTYKVPAVAGQYRAKIVGKSASGKIRMELKEG